MNDDRDFERAVDDWLSEGSDQTPRPAVDAVLLAVRTTPQERSFRIPWRTPPMTLQLRLAAVIAVVAIAGIAGSLIFGPGPGPGPGTSPLPSTVPTSPAPSPTPSGLDTSTWIAYTSERYGFDIKRPPDWNETAADHDWTLPDAEKFDSTASELFEYPVQNQGIIATAWSVAVEPGTTADAWFAAYCPLSTAPCPELQAAAEPTVIDGHPASLVEFFNDVQAFMLVDDRMYVVAEWRPDRHPSVERYGGGKRLVEAFLSTMTLRPGGPAPVASPPALTESFTSNLYGYSIDFPGDFWTATAGTEVWVPGGTPGDGWSDTFLPPSTANGFRAASAMVPVGVTPDDSWIGLNITDTGGECSPPSSTLATIVIDGYEGRVRTSCEEVEATVIVGDRIYLFTLFLDSGEPYSTAGGRALFVAMMATVQLTPETAEVAPSPASS